MSDGGSVVYTTVIFFVLVSILVLCSYALPCGCYGGVSITDVPSRCLGVGK